MARAVIAVLPGLISDVSVAPASADSRLSRDGLTHVLTVASRPPAGTVQPNLLLSLQISEPSAVQISVTDTSGLVATLFQVDIRPIGDPVVCRGELTEK